MLKDKINSLNALILLVSLILFSCNEVNEKNKTSSKEALIKRYFALLDSLPGYDTLNSEYSYMRAYYRNDTAFLKERNKEIVEALENQKKWAFSDSCLRLPHLNKLNASEAYRIDYDGSFCPYNLNITIYIMGEQIELHFFRYIAGREYGPCRVVKQFKKTLTSKDWDDFKKAINYADFWGMKEDNGVYGIDGHTLRIKGIRQFQGYPVPLYKSIFRWSPGHSAIEDLYTKVLKLAGNEDPCIKERL